MYVISRLIRFSVFQALFFWFVLPCSKISIINLKFRLVDRKRFLTCSINVYVLADVGFDLTIFCQIVVDTSVLNITVRSRAVSIKKNCGIKYLTICRVVFDLEKPMYRKKITRFQRRWRETIVKNIKMRLSQNVIDFGIGPW